MHRVIDRDHPLDRPVIADLRRHDAGDHHAPVGIARYDGAEGVRRRAELGPAALQPVVTVAYATGCRIDSEVLPLEWRNVDFDAGEFSLDPEVTKNDQPRTFPMPPNHGWSCGAAQRDRRRRRHRRALPVRPSSLSRRAAAGFRSGTQATPRSCRPRSRIKRFNKALDGGVPAGGSARQDPHDFRRTAIRNMVRRGVPERCNAARLVV